MIQLFKVFLNRLPEVIMSATKRALEDRYAAFELALSDIMFDKSQDLEASYIEYYQQLTKQQPTDAKADLQFLLEDEPHPAIPEHLIDSAGNILLR